MLTKQEHADWSHLLQEALHHGMLNMQPEYLDYWIEDLGSSVRRTFLPETDTRPARIKPSSGLNCQGLAALTLQGKTEERGRPNLANFATGHVHHALCYAALQSALPPDAIELNLEQEFSLPDSLPWWPEKGTPGFSDRSFVDISLRVLEDGWLPEGAPTHIVADIKTKPGRSMAYAKPVHSVDHDVFGNSEQVAVYSEMLGTLDNGAIILSVNKEVPALEDGRFGVSYIWPDDLKRVRDRAQARVEGAIAGKFVPELWLRRNEPNASGRGKLFVPCNKVKGGEGETYCNASAACEALRESWEV